MINVCISVNIRCYGISSEAMVDRDKIKDVDSNFCK